MYSNARACTLTICNNCHQDIHSGLRQNDPKPQMRELRQLADRFPERFTHLPPQPSRQWDQPKFDEARPITQEQLKDLMAPAKMP